MIILKNISKTFIKDGNKIEVLRGLQVELKEQVQAFKNILLRGHDPQAFAKYKGEFYSQIGEVKKHIDELKNGDFRLVTMENLFG